MAHVKDDPVEALNLLWALKDAGVPLPDNTRSAELIFDVNSMTILRIEIMVDAKLLHMIASATAAHLVKLRLVD